MILQLVVLILLIPLPLFFAQAVYGVSGFTAWIVIGVIWTFGAAFTVVIYPLYESRQALSEVFGGVTKVRSWQLQVISHHRRSRTSSAFRGRPGRKNRTHRLPLNCVP